MCLTEDLDAVEVVSSFEEGKDIESQFDRGWDLEFLSFIFEGGTLKDVGKCSEGSLGHKYRRIGGTGLIGYGSA